MQWWKNAVIYQIYPRSFNDSNGDGIGDLKGIIERLDYLQYLGIDAIWLSPVYQSPGYDNGYDISDYESIESIFGTMEDMDHLIKEAHRRHIKIIMDLVVNHTSFKHPWFIEAKQNPESDKRDFYIWRKGKEGKVPNHLQSIFGGSAWEYDETSDEYYLHLFTKEQPDLNWENPKVHQAVYDMMNRWVERGIDGFRMDVIDLIGKVPDQEITANGPNLHPYLQEMHQAVLKDKELMTVGETWGATPEIAKQYSNPSRQELSMVFQFEHITLDQIEGNKWHLKPFDFVALKQVFDKWQMELGNEGWNSLFWNNHDLPRAVSRYGNDSKKYREKSAKMLAMMLHLQKGTPYIYQGEEIGMTNTPVYNYEEINDVESKNYYQIAKAEGIDEKEILKAININGRDNARRPIAWTSEKNGGFTTGIPWLALNDNYSEINVEAAVHDKHSIFNFYRQLIQLRHENDIITLGDFEDLSPNHPAMYAYQRTYQGTKWLVMLNFTDQNIETGLDIPVKKIILTNDQMSNLDTTTLKPYEAVLYQRA